jgi:2-haloacid dehalogenase
LQLLTQGAALGALGSCAREPTAPAPGSRAKIRAICFDLFTIFDPRSAVTVARTIVPAQAEQLCEAWRNRQFEYSWLRAASADYAGFRSVTEDALAFAAKARGIMLSLEMQSTLVDAYSRLEPWPDTRAALLTWKAGGHPSGATDEVFSPDARAAPR